MFTMLLLLGIIAIGISIFFFDASSKSLRAADKSQRDMKSPRNEAKELVDDSNKYLLYAVVSVIIGVIILYFVFFR